MKRCPRCGYVRQPHDDSFVSEVECPKCGIVYGKYAMPEMVPAQEDDKPATRSTSLFGFIAFVCFIAYLAYPLLSMSSLSKPDQMLFAAVDSSDIEGARKAIVVGANINAVNSYGFRPLVNAAGTGNLKLVRLLIEHGADISVTDDNGWTPVHQAAFTGHLQLAKCFIEEGVDVNARSRKDVRACSGALYPAGITAKRIAVIAERKEIADLIARYGGTE